ncbi:hypothetical protein [Streptomyces sp. NPDC050485]|uniref:hypothetical protein n=1 Tax=Streptomyces sp. NPDC050485 TaxID=3365617 RepID=UPI00378D7414
MKPRPTWTTEQIRPVDLAPSDFALINSEWREVLDVYKTPDDFNSDGWSPERCNAVLSHVEQDELYVVVRYLVEETYHEGGDGLLALRRAQLVTVQTACYGRAPSTSA